MPEPHDVCVSQSLDTAQCRLFMAEQNALRGVRPRIQLALTHGEIAHLR